MSAAASIAQEPSSGAPTSDVAPPAGTSLLLGAALVACSTALLPLVRRILRACSREGVDARAPWSLADVAIVAVVVLVSSAMISKGLAYAVANAGLTEQLTGGLASIAIGVAFAAARARGAGVRARDAFATRVDGLPRAAAGAVACYVLLWPGLTGLALAWKALLDRFGVEEQPVVRMMRELAPGERPFALFLGVAAVPLFEELLFRGFLQRALESRMRGGAAVVASGVVFAALHGAAAFLPVLALSLILGSVALTTRRVLAAWVLHALFNAQTFVYLWWDHGASPGLWIG